MDMILLTLIGLMLLAFGLKIYAPAQYLVIGWLVEAMVRAAEQRYKETAGHIDRRSLASCQIKWVLKRFFRIDISPPGFASQNTEPDKHKELRELIEWLIDAAITRLPKTHTTTEDPATGGLS